jgi:hypothetical protein
VSSSNPPTPAAGDTEPGPPLTLPGVALWSDSDPPLPGTRTGADFAGLVSLPSTPMPTIGHIGRYALKYQLGEGGLGTVYAAHDPLLSRLIAVKTLNVEVPEAERESFNALFINEARAAGGLSHPHIVTVFDAGISDKRAYIAMEMLKGRDLRQLRQEGWRATPAQAALIVRRVADALAFAHSKGVIHRDIKPANIFMVGRTQPRVLDFGIARIAHQKDDKDPHSGAGSPYYMAPEQVRREPTDRRADVFSLGVVLYELLTDQKPFRGESLKQIRDAVLLHDPPLASKVDANVPKALALIAARAIAKDPDHRFRSARSFARELRQWLDTNPIGADGESLPAAAATRSNRLPLVWAGAVLTGLAVACVATTVVWWQARTELSSAQADFAAALSKIMPGPALVATPAGTLASAVASGATVAGTRGNAGDPPKAADSSVPDAASLASHEAILSVSLGLVRPTPLQPPGEPEAGGTTTTAARDALRERRAREARPRESAGADARPAPPASVPLPTGTVKLAISPWGHVEVDGSAQGAAPPLTELTLSEGRHQIVVRNAEFAPFVATVNVGAGQSVSLKHKFGP